MRIAIVNITGGGLSGGYKKYLKNMLPRLAAHPDVEALLCAAPDSTGMRDLVPAHKKITFASCRPYALVSNFILSRPDPGLLHAVNAFSTDVVFIPADRYLRFGTLPVVNMIRNMEPFIGKLTLDPLMEKAKKAIQNIDARRSARRSDRVIAVSDYVAQTVTDTWNIAPERVKRVYHGIELPQETETAARPLSIPSEWQSGFLFTCGSIRPARGLEDAVEALAHLAGQGTRHKLVIAGETARALAPYRDELEQRLERNGCALDVAWAGKLGERDMEWCYRNCSFFIMTSRVEACPNIALEAMAHGCLIVSADNPPMPEFFGDTALYYTARDSRSLAKTITDASCIGPARKAEMRSKAVQKASTFSWDRTVDETLAVLAKAAKTHAA